MSENLIESLSRRLAELRADGLYKAERVLATPQGAEISLSTLADPAAVASLSALGAENPEDDRAAAGAMGGPIAGTDAGMRTGREVLNLCANNYLGLGGHPALIEAAKRGLDRWGFGLASVRFICGTQEVHRTLEARLAGYLGTEDAILFGSCFDANGGVFEALLGEEDAVISDELNHASIIDGIRLSKAKRLRYRNNDMTDLEARLKEASGARYRLIVTDGVFSMDGIIADLRGICDLADRYDALVMVDDSHAVGVLGSRGAGTPEHRGVGGRVDILTGTLGKALGGASGGYVAARKEIVAWLRQRARPYLFSNTLAPAIAEASLEAVAMAEAGTELRERLRENSAHFRAGLQASGFTLAPGSHPIIPVLIGDAQKAKAMADRLLELGVYAVAFSFPVVPQGKARIRAQMSAAHDKGQLDRALEAFRRAGKDTGVIA
ncbi:MAG: 2-amino-3-ketobutyrate coenzyme ligase [Fibrobacteres bacterium]|nr:2-amino-3-ketobutyrate coenzyme ligase [Fibrobacterota bacterium]